MGLRKWLFNALRGDKESPPETSTEPVEIGYVPLALSELHASALRAAGFNAHAVPESRVGAIGSIPLQPMARILVPKREAADARILLDEISAT